MRSKGEYYFVSIVDKQTKSVQDFTVSFNTYNSLSVGDSYKEQFYKGGLGIPYQWRK
jgi:hypothetical protein